MLGVSERTVRDWAAAAVAGGKLPDRVHGLADAVYKNKFSGRFMWDLEKVRAFIRAQSEDQVAAIRAASDAEGT